MITLILVLVFLGIAVYFDVRYRGIPKFLPMLFCGIGVGVNLLTGSSLDETFVMLLLICGLLLLASFTRIYARHDGLMLCAITLTTPFMGWMIPSVLCGIFGVASGFVALLILCRIRNAGKPYIDVKNISKKKIKLARLISHVNGGQKFVVPAIRSYNDKPDITQDKIQQIIKKWKEKMAWVQFHNDPNDTPDRFDFNLSRNHMGKTNSKYVIPVIPLVPFFAGWYVVFIVMTLFF
jgi:hypothetical protein